MKKTGVHRYGNTFVYLAFLLPALFFFSAFFLLPFFKSLYLSFTDAYGYRPIQRFVGLANYTEAFSSAAFGKSLAVTLRYTVFVTIVGNLAALGLALLLDGKTKGKKIFRAVFFIPNLMSLIIVGFVWVFLYGNVYRSLFAMTGLTDAYRVSWLGNVHIAVYSIGLTAVWQCAGYYMLIYIAGLQNISQDILEAAAVDGATSWQITRKIKLPSLSPIVFMNSILLMTACFKCFDIPMAMTSGGPAGATTTIALLIYNTGFRANRTGYATAQAVILFLIILLLTMITFLYQNRKEKMQ